MANDLTCPRCGAKEMHPEQPPRLLIRGHKVRDAAGWHSQCLVCAGAYDANLVETPDNYDSRRGWFL